MFAVIRRRKVLDCSTFSHFLTSSRCVLGLHFLNDFLCLKFFNMFLYIWLRTSKKFSIVEKSAVPSFKPEKYKLENKYKIQVDYNGTEFCNVVAFEDTKEKLEATLSAQNRHRVPSEKTLVSVSENSTDDEQSAKVQKETLKPAEMLRINHALENRLNKLKNKRNKTIDDLRQTPSPYDSAEEDFSEMPFKKPKVDTSTKNTSIQQRSSISKLSPVRNRDTSKPSEKKQFPEKCVQNSLKQQTKSPRSSIVFDKNSMASKNKTEISTFQHSENIKNKQHRQKNMQHQRVREDKENNFNPIVPFPALLNQNGSNEQKNGPNARLAHHANKIQSLQAENRLLKQEIEKKNIEFEELKNDFEVLKTREKMFEDLNVQLQKNCINYCQEVKAILVQQKNMPSNSTEQTRHVPSGFIRTDGSQIHVGRGIWIARDTYYLAMSNITSYGMFVKNIAVAVFGEKVLLVSTISGKGSNRNKQQKKPENKLDPVKIFAIKDFYRWWLIAEKKMSELKAEIEAENASDYIRKKIADMKSESRSHKKKTDFRTASKDNNLFGDTEEVSTDDSDEDVPSDVRIIAENMSVSMREQEESYTNVEENPDETAEKNLKESNERGNQIEYLEETRQGDAHDSVNFSLEEAQETEVTDSFEENERFSNFASHFCVSPNEDLTRSYENISSSLPENLNEVATHDDFGCLESLDPLEITPATTKEYHRIPFNQF